MKKLVTAVLVLSVMLSTFAVVSAETLGVVKLTDTYALRDNSELVKYRDTQSGLTERVAVNVTDFNNSAYITDDGGLYKMSGEKLASDAAKVVETGIYVDGVYNGEYAYISTSGTLKLPQADGYSGAELVQNVSATHGNLAMTADNRVYAITKGNGTAMNTEEILTDALSLSGKDGEYLVLDNSAKLWFVPIGSGEYAYDYKKLMLDDNIKYCDTLDGVVNTSNEWLVYDKKSLKAGVGGGSKKLSSVGTIGGTYMYIHSDNSLCCVWNGERVWLQSNFRTVTQYSPDSMAGYSLDSADTLYRQEQDGNSLKSIEVGYPITSIKMMGDGWCIAGDQFGVLYGIDKAVAFGTGVIDENSGVTQVELPINYKTVYVNINGEPASLTRRILETGGRTLYPFREMAEMLGAEVSWDDETKTATAALGENTVSFTVQKAVYTHNGEEKLMDAVTRHDTLTGSVYVPLRYFAEALGFTVDWTGGEYENTINIHK